MTTQIDFWELAAGLILFLFAMSQLESALKSLGGRSLARFLKQQSDNRFKAVMGGLVGTALLQSSSVVALMVLAFVGAGLLSLGGALGVIFGSNLGTTFTGWIIATLGFKVELFSFSLPLIAIGGVTNLFARGRLAEFGKAVLGIGLLLMGLQFMTTSVASLEQLIDVQDLANLAPWQYLLFGVVVAAVIQSSSATMMITLAALNADIISLPSAAAVAIGADLGTTTTVMLGALKGSTPKRQVAAGHVLFNVATDLIAFILRLPLLGLIAAMGIEDPLYALVAFHSLFNLLGLCIFIPFTTQFANLLRRLIRPEETHEAKYLAEVSSGASEAALHATESEAALLITRVIDLIAIAFDPPIALPPGEYPVPHEREILRSPTRDFNESYQSIKRLEGEILDFAIRLQATPLQPQESTRLGQLLFAVREATHSAKSIKDIAHNLAEFRVSSKETELGYRRNFRADMQSFFADLFSLRETNESTVQFDELAEVVNEFEKRHDQVHEKIYRDIQRGSFSESRISSALNVNREILISNRALIVALAYYHLGEQQAEDIALMPRPIATRLSN
jgi:phosphate:Na+ symporter